MGGQGGGTPPAMGGGYAPEEGKKRRGASDLVVNLSSNVSQR